MGNTIFDTELYRRTQEETRNLLKNRVAPPGPLTTTSQKTKATPSPVTINVGAGTGPFDIGDPYVSGRPRQDPLFFQRERQPIGPELSRGQSPGTFSRGQSPEDWLERQRLMSQWAIPTTGGLAEKAIMRDMMRDFPPVLARGGGGESRPNEETQPMSFGPVARDQAQRPLWTTEDLGGGRKRYVLEGDQGWLEAGPGAPGGTLRDTFPVIPPRDISTYQSGTRKVNILGREVEVPIFTTGVEGAPNTGTREEWASYMGRQPGEPSREEEMMRGLMNVIRSPYGYTPSQRSAAAEILGDITRSRTERERLARGAYEFEKMFPLRREEIGIRQGEADTHRFVAEQTAKHQDEISRYITAPSGTTVIDRATGKPVYQAAFAPERAAGIMQYALAAATEEGLTGKMVNPMTFVGMMNMMGSRLGEGYKPITMKEVPKEWVSPYIENRIKRIKPNLKAESDEYKKLYEVYEKALYMTGQ